MKDFPHLYNKSSLNMSLIIIELHWLIPCAIPVMPILAVYINVFVVSVPCVSADPVAHLDIWKCS